MRAVGAGSCRDVSSLCWHSERYSPGPWSDTYLEGKGCRLSYVQTEEVRISSNSVEVKHSGFDPGTLDLCLVYQLCLSNTLITTVNKSKLEFGTYFSRGLSSVGEGVNALRQQASSSQPLRLSCSSFRPHTW